MKINCFTCKYGYEDEQMGFPMCHHPKRFSVDCVDFNMHEEKETKESEKPVPDAIGEAAVKYADETYYAYPQEFLDFVKEEIRDAYIAGAKWQKEQDRLEIANIKAKLWQDGFNDCKEQMMKEAVPFYEILKAVPPGPERENVRIIIVKED